MSNKGGIFIPMGADVSALEADLQKAIAIVQANASKVDAAVKQQAAGVNTLTKEYRAQFAEAQKLTQMGSTHQAAFVEAAKAAGQYKNDLDDTREVIKAFSSDTPVLTATLGAMQGLAGAASAVAGAYGLMGVEGEEVQKVMLKVQSAMALAQGLQAVGAMADSFKALKIVLVAEVVPALMTVSGAMIATGIGALVIAVAALAAYWSNVADEAEKAEQAQLAAAETEKKIAELNRKSTDDLIALRELQVRAMANGKAKEIASADLAMKKEIYAAKLIAAEHQGNYLYQARLQEKLKAITEHYARQRAEIEKKYAVYHRGPTKVEPLQHMQLRTQQIAIKPRDMRKDTKAMKKDAALKPIENLDQVLAERLARFRENMAAFSREVAATVSSAAAQGLGSMAEAIGAALVNGNNVFESAGRALLATLGGFLVQLGQLMITTGIAATGLKAALSNMFTAGPALIGLGVLTIAAGAAVSALASGTSSKMGGGGGGGAGGMAQGFYGASTGGVNTAGNMKLETKVRGADLYFVMEKASNSKKRF